MTKNRIKASWSRTQRLFLICVLGTLFILAVGTTIYYFYGHGLIRTVYEGKSSDFLNSIIEHSDKHPLEFYLSKGDRVVYGSWFLPLILFPLIYFLKYVKREFLWLAILIIGDIVFLILSVVVGGPFSITSDRTVSEFYQYLKEVVVAGIFLTIYLKKRDMGFLSFTLIFIYLFADDALMYHEQAGIFLRSLYDLSDTYLGALIGEQNAGELISLVLPGAILGIIFLLAYLKASRASRILYHRILLLLLILVFFGVFLDIIHELMELSKFGRVLGIIEDFGEMLVMSIILWYAIHIKREQSSYPASQ
jgi:hypothetical protein